MFPSGARCVWGHGTILLGSTSPLTAASSSLAYSRPPPAPSQVKIYFPGQSGYNEHRMGSAR